MSASTAREVWSFKHAERERRVKAMVERIAPDVFVCCSADLIPRWGEYERTVATVLNAYLGGKSDEWDSLSGSIREERLPIAW